MKASLARQSGHAAMLFAMMIPAFFAVFILASDGARALQSKARLEEASEVAVLAIAARNADNDAAGAAINKKIATDYISQYMGDMESISQLDVIKQSCEQIPECVKNVKKGKARFFQYRIHTKTDHKSWFPSKDALASFGEKFTVAGSATARKYQSEAVDVMFVTDFSGSMRSSWKGKKKYLALQDIIAVVTDELEKFNKLNSAQNNTVGNVSYNRFTQKSKTDPYCFVSQLIWKDDGYTYKFMDGNWYRRENHRNWYGKYDWYRVNRENVDYQKTVEQLFEPKDLCMGDYYGSFHDIELTDKFDPFNDTMSNFNPRGSYTNSDGYDTGTTASYEGIIRGTQLLLKGKNARRLLIVLSDGFDEGANAAEISKELVKQDMCSTIQTKLSEDTADGKKIKARLAVIGFNYDVTRNQTLAKCVGTDNVYKAENRNDILNKILELISEEIGHLK